MREHGTNGFPYVKIGDEVVVGYNPKHYSENGNKELILIYLKIKH